MGRFVAISKAARLAGLSSREFQQLMREKQLTAVRGMVHLDDLADMCPQLHIEDTNMVEWVEYVKDQPKEQIEHKRVNEMSRDQLMGELTAAYQRCSYYQRRVTFLEHSMKEAIRALKSVKFRSNEPNRVQSLIAWLEKKIGDRQN